MESRLVVSSVMLSLLGSMEAESAADDMTVLGGADARRSQRLVVRERKRN